MSESRQQRRARERAEQKAASRPGPNHRPSPPQTATKWHHVIVADLRRFADDDEGPDWVDWSYEYELLGESVGIDDSGSTDLQDVVNGVLD
jgi:hypothetical protein